MASILPDRLNFKRAKDCGLRVSSSSSSSSLNRSQSLGCLEPIGTMEIIFLSAVTGFLLVVVKGSLVYSCAKFASAEKKRRLMVSDACSYKHTHGNDRSGR